MNTLTHLLPPWFKPTCVHALTLDQQRMKGHSPLHITLVKLLTHPILLVVDMSSLLVICCSTSRMFSAGSVE